MLERPNFTKYQRERKRLKFTTRGTPRQRMPKGYWAEFRYSEFKQWEPEVIQSIWEGKLKRMSSSKRELILTRMADLPEADRWEFMLRTLADIRTRPPAMSPGGADFPVT